MSECRLLNIDCMEFMAECEDNEYDLAIVDPPYFQGPNKTGYYDGTKQKGIIYLTHTS